MDKMRRQWIENYLIRLVQSYPNASVPKITIKAMAEGIDMTGVPKEYLEQAYSIILREQEFFPSVAAIIKVCERIDDATFPRPTADEEWAWVIAHIGGGCLPCDWRDHELATTAVDIMGGWQYLGLGLTKDRPFRKREFAAIYDSLETREQTQQLMTIEGKAKIESAIGGRLRDLIGGSDG